MFNVAKELNAVARGEDNRTGAEPDQEEPLDFTFRQ